MNVCLINLYSSVKRNLNYYSSNIEFNFIFIDFHLEESKKFLRKLFLKNSIDWFKITGLKFI